MGRIRLGTRVGFYLSELQIKRLRKLSEKTSISVSEHIRRAIDEYLERFDKGRKSKKPPKPAGWTEGGDLSEIIIK